MTKSKRIEDEIKVDEISQLLEGVNAQYDQYVQLALLAASVEVAPEAEKHAPNWTQPMGIVITNARDHGVLG